MEKHRTQLARTTRSSLWKQITAERITAFGSITLAFVSIYGLAIAKHQIDEMHEETKMQHLTSIVDKWDSPDWSAIRKSLAEQRLDKGHSQLLPLDVENAPAELYDELGFCEDIDILTEHGYLDRHDVWNEFADWLFPVYEDARPLIVYEQRKHPAEFRECSNLVESIRPIEDKEDNGADRKPSKEDISVNYFGDLEMQPGQPANPGRKTKKQ